MNRWRLALVAVALITLVSAGSLNCPPGQCDDGKGVCQREPCKKDNGRSGADDTTSTDPTPPEPATTTPATTTSPEPATTTPATTMTPERAQNLTCYGAEKISGDCSGSGCEVPNGPMSSYCKTDNHLQCHRFICRERLLCRKTDRRNGTMVNTCTCTSGLNGYQCKTEQSSESVCPEGYCSNGGRCLVDAKDPEKRSCQCPSAFTGDRCESNATGNCAGLAAARNKCPLVDLTHPCAMGAVMSERCTQIGAHASCLRDLNVQCNLQEVNDEIIRLLLLKTTCCFSTSSFNACIQSASTAVECTDEAATKLVKAKCDAQNVTIGDFGASNEGMRSALCNRTQSFVACVQQVATTCSKEFMRKYWKDAEDTYSQCCFGEPSAKCRGTPTATTPVPPASSPCKSNPCRNSGTCTSSNGKYRCTCKSGFEGDQCDKAIDWCPSSSCPSNAACDPLPNGRRCLCAAGFNGTRCEQRYFTCPAAGTFGDSVYCDLFYQCASKDANPKRLSCTVPLGLATPTVVLLFDSNTKRCRPEADFKLPKSGAQLTRGCV